MYQVVHVSVRDARKQDAMNHSRVAGIKNAERGAIPLLCGADQGLVGSCGVLTGVHGDPAREWGALFKVGGHNAPGVPHRVDVWGEKSVNRSGARGRQRKKGGLGRASPWLWWLKSEGQAEAKLAPEGARSRGAGGVDEADRMAEGVRASDAVAVIVAIVGPVGEVKGLRDELQVDVLAELEVFRQAEIKLEERIAAKGIIFCNGATRRYSVEAVKAVLSARVVASESEVVLGVQRKVAVKTCRTVFSISIYAIAIYHCLNSTDLKNNVPGWSFVRASLLK